LTERLRASAALRAREFPWLSLAGPRGCQRIGSAAGIAIAGNVFYNQLASTHGDDAAAFRMGIVSIAAFVTAALALVLADAFTRDS
jgi:hypothetical protein